jgi:hypothetical protein
MHRTVSRFRPVLESLEERCVLSVGSDLDAFAVADEARVRDLLGDLVTLDALDDLNSMIDLGYLPGHAAMPFSGIGLAFDNTSAINGADPELGVPTALLYQPTVPSDVSLLFDLVPDTPYHLIGWAYGFDYDPQALPDEPDFNAVPADAWQVHEAGYHFLVGPFLPTPPQAEVQGDVPLGSLDVNDSPGDILLTLWHPRFWTISFYIDPAGGPARSAIFDPFGRELPGFPEDLPGFPENFSADLVRNFRTSFFFPQLPYRATPQPAAHVEAENFDMAQGYGWFDQTAGNAGKEYRLTDVDIALTGDSSGGLDVFSIGAGEFLQYTIDVPTAGVQDFAFRMANTSAGARFRVLVDGVDRTGLVEIPHRATTQEWFTFAPLSMNLSTGQHVARIVFESFPSLQGATRFNFFSVTPAADPTAELVGTATAARRPAFSTITVRYQDNAAVSVATLGSFDLRVTGPNGFDQLAVLQSANPSGDGDTITAEYRLDAPGEVWDPGENGTYQIALRSNQVSDTRGHFVPAAALGSLSINVPQVILDRVPGSLNVTLTVNGTDLGENIVIANTLASVKAFVNGVEVASVSPSILKGISVFANGGDDTMTVAPPLPVRPLIDLGEGEDGIVVQGTDRNDFIVLQRRTPESGPQLSIYLNGRQLDVTYVNGETVSVFAGRGNDSVVSVGPMNWQMRFFGEEGRDVLVGSSPGDLLDGGPGKNIIIVRRKRVF